MPRRVLRTKLSDGTDGGFAPISIGSCSAKPTEDGNLAIEKSDGTVVYLALAKLEDHITNGDLLVG